MYTPPKKSSGGKKIYLRKHVGEKVIHMRSEKNKTHEKRNTSQVCTLRITTWGKKWGKGMYVRKMTCIYIKRHGKKKIDMERYSKKRDL